MGAEMRSERGRGVGATGVGEGVLVLEKPHVAGGCRGARKAARRQPRPGRRAAGVEGGVKELRGSQLLGSRPGRSQWGAALGRGEAGGRPELLGRAEGAGVGGRVHRSLLDRSGMRRLWARKKRLGEQGPCLARGRQVGVLDTRGCLDAGLRSRAVSVGGVETGACVRGARDGGEGGGCGVLEA